LNIILLVQNFSAEFDDQEKTMKKILVAASLVLACNLANAGETIQLAAAIGSGASTSGGGEAMTATSAGEAAGGAGAAASATAGAATANMVAVGVIAASGVAVAAEAGGTSSTTSH